jgi:hypothetical protein
MGVPNLAISDAQSGLRAAFKASLIGTKWRGCQLYLQQNAQETITKQHLKSKVPKTSEVFSMPMT